MFPFNTRANSQRFIVKADRIRRATSNAAFAPLTEDQQIALTKFADANGRLWKARLAELWVKAAAEPTLHHLRNTHGPDWLRAVNADSLRPKA